MTLVATEPNNPLWSQKYRPGRVRDVILPKRTKAEFQKMVDDGSLPMHMLLAGPAGCGKTTVATAALREIGADYMIINASLRGNIDTLRTDLAEFASTVSFAGGRKYVVLDEADHLTHATQPALRNFMEEYSANAGFILTVNYKDRLIKPLHSRCAVVDFKISPAEAPVLQSEFWRRACDVLRAEGVEHDPAVVAEVVQRHFPDMRRALNELQHFSRGGPIDSGVLRDVRQVQVDDLVGLLRDRNFTSVRKWVRENSHVDQVEALTAMYHVSRDAMTTDSAAAVVVILAKYQAWAAVAADPEVNLAAALAEVMVTAVWR